MLFLRRPTRDVIKQLLLARHGMTCSYPHVGATRAAPPAGWCINHMRKLLGTGRAVHDRAVAALFTWKALTVDGLEVFSPTPEVRPEADVAILSRHFGIWSVDFCRVIYLLQGEGEGAVERTGFGYGTLPGHAVRGEELFSIEWHRATEEVWYDIFSFSQPANVLIRLLSPVARVTQRRFARASLAKTAELAKSGG